MRNLSRQQAILNIQKSNSTILPSNSSKSLCSIFGKNVFNYETMKQRLPQQIYKDFISTIEHGKQLDSIYANQIACALKDWAISHGATHYSHWFQPMTGSTAEKHDTFLNVHTDGRVLNEFTGSSLTQGEPDASSFPSGGIRATFEARGYTAWDPTSPCFIMDDFSGSNGTLCIPSIFCSYNGQTLDEKTPLLRSLDSLSYQSVRLLKLIGKDVKRVTPFCGIEQEYFLIDRSLYFLRPDLVSAGRTLFGAKPPKGQEMEDHYFGAIRRRVLAFMVEAETECYKVGIPIKTRHNEAAPAQFEVAPIFERANIATDHNLLIMEIFRRVAIKHNFEVLFGEKPFKDVNGSGKHVNWSLADENGHNYLNPGTTPKDNAQFLLFVTAVIRAVSEWSNILRLSVASHGNDHRLGSNEAPPAILSVYMGEELNTIIEGLISNIKNKEKKTKKQKVFHVSECKNIDDSYISRTVKPGPNNQKYLHIGVESLPALPRDLSDRNRTSPFAFTGNKFEFRAVGSSQGVSRPISFLNTAVAESLDFIATMIEKKINLGETISDAIQSTVEKVLYDHNTIIFNGDNYTKEWKKEAASRGLLCYPTTVDCASIYTDKKVIGLFEKYNVLSKVELESRKQILLETYCKKMNIETLLTGTIAKQHILPAAFLYEKTISTFCNSNFNSTKRGSLALHTKLCDLIESLTISLEKLEKQNMRIESLSNILDISTYYMKDVIPTIQIIRKYSDEIENCVDDNLWSLPKYQEMLFIY